MFAGLIFIPSFILAITLFLLSYNKIFLPFSLIWLAVIPFAIGLGAYIVRNGLNEWWYVRNPPGLSDVEKDILARFFPYYRKLNVQYKKKFENRLSVFRLQKQFQMRILEKIPGDLQLLVSATAIQLTMGMEDEKEILDNLGKKIVIMHPGPINRGVEITSDVADSDQSIILNQVENGVAVRMAVIYLLAQQIKR